MYRSTSLIFQKAAPIVEKIKTFECSTAKSIVCGKNYFAKKKYVFIYDMIVRRFERQDITKNRLKSRLRPSVLAHVFF
jgi:hypothetical protein